MVTKATEYVDSKLAEIKIDDLDYLHLIEDGTLTYAKKVLGEFRCRFKQSKGQVYGGVQLVNEAAHDLIQWRRQIKEQKRKYGKK